MTQRLRRLDRIFVHHPVYFVTACTHGRAAILNNHEAHSAFHAFCKKGCATGCAVGRYVLMPDHVHLFVAFSPAADLKGRLQPLSAWVKSLKGVLSNHWRARGIGAPHWQKGFFDHVLRSSESYAEKWRYVLENPVRAGLVERADEWPYQGEICRLEAASR